MKKRLLILVITVVFAAALCALAGCDKPEPSDLSTGTTLKITCYDGQAVVTTVEAYADTGTQHLLKLPLKSESEKEGYEFDKWYLDAALTIPATENSPISADISLYGKWFRVYSVTVTGNVQKNFAPFNYVKKVRANTPFGSYGTTQTGYEFGGIYTDDTCTVNFDLTAPVTEDITAYVQWQLVQYTVTYAETYGAVHTNPLTVTYETPEVRLTAPGVDRLGYFFEGWKNQNGVTVKNIGAHQSADLTLTAVWKKYKLNTDGTYSFGYYPQTLKAADVTVSGSAVASGDAKGYYRGSDGFYYAKAIAPDLGVSNEFNPVGLGLHGGEAVIANREYYFKVEPIIWQVIGEETGKVSLWSNQILDYQYFESTLDRCGESGYFRFSSLQVWLNDGFLKAFPTEIKESISTENYAFETVMGSAAANDCFCKVALPSVGNHDFCDMTVLKINSFGRKTATDYAICAGIGSYNGTYAYWLRNIGSDEDCVKTHKYNDVFDERNACKDLGEGDYASAKAGVAPVLTLSLD